MAPRDTRNSEPAKPGATVSVLLPLPVAGPYDYRVPEGCEIACGDLVEVPLGARRVTGVAWGPGSGAIDEARLRDIVRRLPVRPLGEPLRRLVDWVARYTLYRPGAVLRMVLSVPEAAEPPRPVVLYERNGTPEGLRLTPGRRRVLDTLDDGPPRAAAELAREAGVGVGVVKGLVEAGALVAREAPPPDPFARPDPQHGGPTLSAAQARAAATLVGAVESPAFRPWVLDGVTGSGKTEVYFEAIAAALSAGRQALVLLPEIALGAQWLERFEARFGARPAEWHSELTRGTRRATWRAVAEDRAPVVVGARSALFLPFPDLGLIVVDEEHDGSYKQEDGVVYHARDMAVVRARLEGIPVVLASATPSLETVVNVQQGRYGCLELPQRHGGAALPDIVAVDMRQHAPPARSWLSPPLRIALAETLAAGEQAMLFLNRRGYAPLTLCRQCGHRLQCPRCTAWLVEHRLSRRLECHHCGHMARQPDACPECGAEDSLVACGPGVERIAEEVANLLPDARVAVMASDTVRGPGAARAFVERIAAHEIDIVIGTQVIAKGHHFPLMTLVGIVDADLGLAGGDLRAAERSFQLLYQVAGRAGRSERPGRVMVQTYMPDHPVMRALAGGDRARFLEVEAAQRRDRLWPPFGKLAALVVAGRDEQRVDATAAALGRAAPRGRGVEVLGPAPAPLAVLRGRHRRRLLLRAAPDGKVQQILRRWLSAVRVPSGVRVHVDVNPYSFL